MTTTDSIKSDRMLGGPARAIGIPADFYRVDAANIGDLLFESAPRLVIAVLKNMLEVPSGCSSAPGPNKGGKVLPRLLIGLEPNSYRVHEGKVTKSVTIGQVENLPEW